MSGSVSRGVAAIVTLCLAMACAGKPDADEHLRKADEYVRQARLQEAVLEYRIAIQADPKRADVRLKLADTLMLVSDTRGALQEYVRAADLLPKDPTAQIKAGSLLLLAGAFEDAKTRADKAMALDPKSATAQILRGNALAGLKDLDGAVSEYQQALAVNPTQGAAYGNIARIELARGRSDEAEASFRKAIEVAPSSIDAHLSLANFLWASDRAPEAEQAFKDALPLDPTNVSANRAIGMFFVATGRLKDAEPYFQTIAKTTKTTAAAFSLSDYYVISGRYDEATKILRDIASQEVSHEAATIRLAAVDSARGDRVQAMSKLREVLDKRPKEMVARLLLARLLLADRKPTEAFAQASSIVRDEPNSTMAGDAYLLIAGIHASSDRPQEAIAAYEEVVKRQAKPLAADLALAALHLNADDPKTAMTYAQQALAIQPGNTTARALMVRIQTAQKDFARAKETLATLEKEFPNSQGTFTLQGELALAEGRMDVARASYTKAASVTPADPEVLRGLARIDVATGRPNDAVARIEAALKQRVSADLLLLAAATYSSAGNATKAEESLVRAIQLQPNRMQAYALLGALYVGQDRLNEARERFEQAVKNDPKSVAMNTVLAMVLQAQNHLPEAEKQYRSVLGLDPKAPVASNNLAWMYVSSNRNLDEALVLAQTAMEQMTDEPTVTDTLGWIYYKKNMTSQAVQYLETSVQKAPKYADAHYHLGMAYIVTGDLPRARKALERSLALQGDFEGAADARKALATLATTGN